MQKFIKSTLLFSFQIILAFVIFFWLNKNYLPAPKFSNIVSYNEKAAFVRNNGLDSINILSIGSSITLSNLSSEAIKNKFPDKKHINLSSLGMTIRESRLLLERLLPEINPEIIIMFGYPVDFRNTEGESRVISINHTCDFISDDCWWKYYVKFPEINYYVKRTLKNRFIDKSSSEYEKLNFDYAGGIPLYSDGGESRLNRFNKSPIFPIDANNYYEFDTLIRLLDNWDINFYYIQTPVREGLLTEEVSNYLKNHSTELNNKLTSKKHSIYDCNEISWPDSLFIDYIHMEKNGAKILSEYVLNKISPI